jgi:hypothetical protein
MPKLPEKLKRVLRALSLLVGLILVLAGLQSAILNVSGQLHPIMFVAPVEMDFGMSFPQEVRTGEFVVVAKYSYPDEIHYYISQRPKPIWPEPEDCEQNFEYIEEARIYCQNNPQDFDCCYPSICRYLKKISEEDEGDLPVHATLNPIGGADLVDYWLAEFHVPTIKGYVGQDYTDIPIDFPGFYGCDIHIAFGEGTYCGDGIKQSPNDFGAGGPLDDGYEDCDVEDGVPEDYYCTQNCVLEQIPPPEPYCGDGNIDFGEECDDDGSNGIPCTPAYGFACTYCSSECETIRLEGSYCGDGYVDSTYEECEYDADCGEGMTCVGCLCKESGGPETECTPENTQPCDTGQLGICAVGIQTCDEESFWGDCTGVNEPVTEICGNALDDDCDGSIDEGCVTIFGGGGGGSISLIIFNEQNGEALSSTAIVNWFTNTAATSRVIYDTVSHPILGSPPNYGYAFSSLEDPTKVTFHSVTITGLIPGTSYYWRAISHGSGEVWGDELVFTTPTITSPPPITPPSIPPTQPGPPSPSVPPTGGEGTIGGEEMALGISPEEEITIGGEPEKEPGTGFEKFLAAISSFYNVENPCWIFSLGIIILIILFLLSEKKREGKKKWTLPIIILIAIILYWAFCPKTFWILIVAAIVLFILSLIFKRKKKETVP